MVRARAEGPAARRAPALGLLVAALMAANLMLTAKPAHADTFTVTNTNDSGNGSLRQQILDANTSKGKDTIEFDIPGGGVKTISPTSQLPAITGPVVIDGYSQPGSRPNSQVTGLNTAIILVELSGINAGQFAGGLDIQASNTVVRGLAINRFANSGILISRGAQGARIEGNFLGTDASGTLDRGNDDGVVILSDAIGTGGGSNNTIGGASPDKRNLISGNNNSTVVLDGKGSNKVLGNLIGVQKDGISSLGGHRSGVEIASPNNTVGGAKPEEANVIANSFGDGVSVEGTSNTSNRILGNSIFGNGDLGIDLALGGREQDPRDPDTGVNNLQNFPVVESAVAFEGGTTTIEGTLDSTPSTRKKKTFTIQFFSNPRGEDEGKTFLGQTTARTDKQGNASFSFETTKSLEEGDRITATATDSKGNTSEFSDPVGLATD